MEWKLFPHPEHCCYVVKVTKTQKAENLKVKAETLSMAELLMSHELRKSEVLVRAVFTSKSLVQFCAGT